MVDVATIVVTAGITTTVALCAYSLKSLVAVDKTLAAHIAADAEVFKSFVQSFAVTKENLTDLKTEQKVQSDKLDQLVSECVDRVRIAATASAHILSAAEVAMRLLEAAKGSALEVVAAAAATAKKAL